MSEWWTYRLSSFLLFSPRTWLRLLELYNNAIWPLQIASLGIGIALVAAALKGGTRHNRLATGLLAACWLWVASAFLIARYASINWAATYFAIAFGIEGALLAWFGTIRGVLSPGGTASIGRRAGPIVVLFALFGQPVIGWASGAALVQTQYFGVAPDPTAVATMGFVLAAGRYVGRLLAIPLLWCAVSGAFAWAMGLHDAYVTPAAALVVLALAWLSRVHDPSAAPMPARRRHGTSP